MNLEILKALPSAPSAKPPLLFLHGAFSGAWVWAEHVLGFMADRGYAAYALSFRGHGRSEGRGDLDRHGLADYADDVRTAIRSIGGRPPVLVGHSMGGLVAQRCLGQEQLAGVALMAPVPPEGVMAANAHLVLRDSKLDFGHFRARGGGAGDRLGWRVPAKRRRHAAPAVPLRRGDPMLRAALPRAELAARRGAAGRGDPGARPTHRDQHPPDRRALPRAAVHQLPSRAEPRRLERTGGRARAAGPAAGRFRAEGAGDPRRRRHDRAPARQAHPRQGHLPRPGPLLEGPLRQGQRPALALPDAAGPRPLGGADLGGGGSGRGGSGRRRS